MAYTTIPTLTDVVLSAAQFNAYIRDNQRALKDPPSQNYETNEGADYSTALTTWSAVDAVNLSLSITTTGGDVLISFTGSLIGSGNTGILDVAVDGTRIVNQADGGLAFVVTATGARLYSICHIVQGLSAGAHTFVLQWRAYSGTIVMYAGAGTASYDIHPQFFVRELS